MWPNGLYRKAALSKARMKLKFEAFVELNLQLITYFEKHFQSQVGLAFDCWPLTVPQQNCR
jgi:hypothetical protein